MKPGTMKHGNYDECGGPPVEATKDSWIRGMKISKWWHTVLLCTLISFFLVLLVMMVYHYCKGLETFDRVEESESSALVNVAQIATPTATATQTDGNMEPFTVAKSPKYFGRRDWQARPSVEEIDKLPHPVSYVIIHDSRVSNVSRNCSTFSECSSCVQDIQRNHMEHRGWSDIAFNFLVGGDGNIYVGRGWNLTGAHTYKYNIKSIGICFIGDFSFVKPPIQQLEAAKRIIEEGLVDSIIAVDYKLEGCRDLRPYKSPGDALYNIIKTWHQWVRTAHST